MKLVASLQDNALDCQGAEVLLDHKKTQIYKYIYISGRAEKKQGLPRGIMKKQLCEHVCVRACVLGPVCPLLQMKMFLQTR